MNEHEVLNSPIGLPIYTRGPKLSEGSLPAFFYFALSGNDSLYLNPFNQPIAFLEHFPIRCISFTLPFHGHNYDNNKALELYEHELQLNPNFLDKFFMDCLRNIDYLVQQKIIDEEKIAVGGLSRGGFIATHLAARDPRLKYILGFAPLTRFPGSFGLDLHSLVEKLTDKHVRFYIGNRDLRVGTEACFQFISLLTENVFHHGHRSPPIELIISPSIGFKGHGTPPHVFKAGAQWIVEKLLGKSM